MLTRRESGQGILEFAVIFPLFMILVFIMIDAGLTMGRYSEVGHATKEAARVGATGADPLEIYDTAVAQSQGWLEGAALSCPGTSDRNICIEYVPGDGGQQPGEVGAFVKVRVHYKYSFLTPTGNVLGMSLSLPDGIDVESCAVARLERPAASPAPTGSAAC